MLAAGIINCTVPATVPLLRLLLVGVGALESGQAAYPPLTFPLALLIWAPAIPIGILMIVGGSSLVRRREGGVVVGIVASMIPLTPLFPVTLFIGIWSLLVFLLPPKDSEAKPLNDHEMAEAQQRVAGPAGGLLLIVSLYIVMIAIGVVAVFMLSLG